MSREVTITHPYVPTPIWREIHEDQARFKVVVAGRRSGKSTGSLNHANFLCVTKPGARVWVVAPTYNQARDIYWLDKKMSEYIIPETIAKKNESELMIKYKNGSVLQFKGAQNYDSLVGSGLDFLICDEVAKWDRWSLQWEQNLRPSLMDKNGGAIFISTPEGYNHFYELYEEARVRNDVNWKAWKFATWESGADWIGTVWGKELLEKEKNSMTEDKYMQEYGAEFRTYTGAVFKEFNRSVHVEEFVPDNEIPFEMGVDFGNPMPTACLYTYFDRNDELWVVDEYYRTQRPLIDHVGDIMAIRNKYPNNSRYWVGDSHATQELMECSGMGLYITPVNKLKDSVSISISRIEERLKINPVTKRAKIHIHPRCENLIMELEKFRWDENKGVGFKDKKPIDEFDHAISALRYIILHHTKRQDKMKVIKSTYKPRSWRDYMSR